ncbi:endonuclease domain-containing protein [Streptomyces sp. MI02-7b]|uniref:endonuclease domain-containing protein n=1 Tax=Streptomyces sp. MI02-7b TaxID=462941 RepID=UPI0029A5A8AF|nr:endonuclease domain-containing protein [Streptomyces sp. MI02-7b]MDX3075938.1 endonuclease domain-containing protein [Streptomyces sp. MI02-7b]
MRWPRSLGGPAPACPNRATAEQRDRAAAELAREEEDIWGPLARLHQAPPACWSWEVTADHTATALRSAFAASQAAAERIAESLLDAWHAGRCAICGPSAILAGELVTDHDHATGLVRGLLCHQCNTYEGLNCGGRDTAGVYLFTPGTANAARDHPWHPAAVLRPLPTAPR